MSTTDLELIAKLRDALTSQKYSLVVIGNYCTYARWFLEYLARRKLPIADVTEAEVEKYLRHAMAMFRKRHGRLPGARWHAIPRSGIHALLRLSQGQWPPARKATCAAEAMRSAICDEYETWLRELRDDELQKFVHPKLSYSRLAPSTSSIRYTPRTALKATRRRRRRRGRRVRAAAARSPSRRAGGPWRRIRRRAARGRAPNRARRRGRGRCG